MGSKLLLFHFYNDAHFITWYNTTFVRNIRNCERECKNAKADFIYDPASGVDYRRLDFFDY